MARRNRSNIMPLLMIIGVLLIVVVVYRFFSGASDRRAGATEAELRHVIETNEYNIAQRRILEGVAADATARGKKQAGRIRVLESETTEYRARIDSLPPAGEGVICPIDCVIPLTDGD